eukprot:gene50411-20678_t
MTNVWDMMMTRVPQRGGAADGDGGGAGVLLSDGVLCVLHSAG